MTDLDPKHYRIHSELQYNLAHEILDSLFLKGHETILDVGCGEGRVTAEIAKRVPKGSVMGVDPSAAMITDAKDSFPHLKFVEASAEQFQVQEPVDLILVLNTLHWVRDPKQACIRFFQNLKPGGQLFILTYPKESPYWAFLEDVLQEKKWRPYAKLSAYQTALTSSEYKVLLEEKGFDVEENLLEERVASYQTSMDLVDYIKGWLQCYLPFPKELQCEFLEAAAKTARHHSLSKEKYELPFLKLTLKARKKLIY